MQSADFYDHHHPPNRQISIEVLSNFMNSEIAKWFNPPYLTTIDQINSQLPQETNPENLAHFQVYLILGGYLLSATSRQDLRENVTYDEIITRFNQEWVPKQCPMCHEPSYNPMKVQLWCSNYHSVCAKCAAQLCRPLLRDRATFNSGHIECPICKELIPRGRASTDPGWLMASLSADKALKHYNLPTPGQNISGGRTRRKRKGGKV